MEQIKRFFLFLLLVFFSVHPLLSDILHDTLYSLITIVDGIIDHQANDVLNVMLMDRQSYETWDVNKMRGGYLPISDYTIEAFFQNIEKGEYAIIAYTRDSSCTLIRFATEQIGFSRINDKKTLMRYDKKNNGTGIIFPPFDSVKFSIPETKVMRIILCNPKEGLDLTIE